MCSRYLMTSPPEAVRSWFRTENGLDFPPRTNIAPTQPVVIVRNNHRGQREMALVRWGLIPVWAKDLSKLSTILNARVETATEKPSFRGPIRHRRCLVPADGWYEWTGPPRHKQPHLIRRKLSGGGPGQPGQHGGTGDSPASLLALAGLHEHWVGADGSEIETMAILTAPANADIAHLHDRMPVVLEPRYYDRWLDTTPGSAEPILDLLAAPAAGVLEAVMVDRRIGNSRYDGPLLVVESDGTPNETSGSLL